jgi:hypothetical protein
MQIYLRKYYSRMSNKNLEAVRNCSLINHCKLGMCIYKDHKHARTLYKLHSTNYLSICTLTGDINIKRRESFVSLCYLCTGTYIKT